MNLNRQMTLRRAPAAPGADSNTTEKDKISMRLEFDEVLKIDLDAAAAECLSMDKEVHQGR